jgi:predicted 3-demethylubiquinone-9 3-methyltransferase (glyoxalase superfamily)
MSTQKITTFLMFPHGLEDAVKRYVSIFEKYGSKIVSSGKGPDGKMSSAELVLAGQTFLTFEGGPHFSFSQGISLFVSCETQEEVDELWTRLSADGGKEQQCGWVQDKWGVSWQIVPKILNELLSSPDRARAGRAVQAMLKMKKLDIAELKKAADSE